MGAQRSGKNKEKMRFISRIDSGSTHTWWVRIWKNGENVSSQTFSDGVYGSKRKSFEEAKRYRDRQIIKNEIKARQTTSPRNSHKNNTSGVIGVVLGATYRESTEFWYYAWIAKYQRGTGKLRRQTSRSFSVNKYGYEEAFWMAVNERFKGIGKPVPTGLRLPKKPDYI